jgi:ATP-dependent DNA ligase
MFAGALALGLEGIVAKDAASLYIEDPRLTGHSLKIKNRDFQRKEKVEFRQNRR